MLAVGTYTTASLSTYISQERALVIVVLPQARVLTSHSPPAESLCL